MAAASFSQTTVGKRGIPPPTNSTGFCRGHFLMAHLEMPAQSLEWGGGWEMNSSILRGATCWGRPCPTPLVIGSPCGKAAPHPAAPTYLHSQGAAELLSAVNSPQLRSRLEEGGLGPGSQASVLCRVPHWPMQSKVRRGGGLNGNVTFTLVKSLVETLVNALKKGPLPQGSESKSPAALRLSYLVPG